MEPAPSPLPDAPQGEPHLLETMRLGPGGVELLGLHLARLRASAEAWGYPYREASVREAIRAAEASALAETSAAASEGPEALTRAGAEASKGLEASAAWADETSAGLEASTKDAGEDSGGLEASQGSSREGVPSVWRLRLTLAPSGEVRVEVSALAPRPLETAAVWPEPFVLAGSAVCVHKTTARTHYEAPLRWARGLGADEALLVNPEGGLVEGAWTSVWVRREGRLLTPHLAAGGLPGVYRAHLLASLPEASEASLVPFDLFSAEAVYLSNALRGLVRIHVLRA